jgi:hypothetical protein
LLILISKYDPEKRTIETAIFRTRSTPASSLSYVPFPEAEGGFLVERAAGLFEGPGDLAV